jgi:predicted TIM-barrel fold metal-dependent hydrolase
VIDYWCNAFTPDRRALWDTVIAEQGLSIKVRRNEDDAFAEPAEMRARMDELGFATLILPCADVPRDAGPFAYERYATRFDEMAKLHAEHPGRFAGAWSIDPGGGAPALRRAAHALDEPWCVALHLHTHSFDRPFDHPDYHAFHALAVEREVPFVMQAGASGGRLPSECGRPLGVDRPALAFPELRFVLSHTGWPWVDEALAMAGKHPNVFLGTASYPPHRWSAELVRFVAGAGRGKVLFGTSFPVVGHRHALALLPALGLDAAARAALLDGVARRLFTRLGPLSEERP